jgi:hypothetical protein
MELDLQSLFGLHVHSCTHWMRPRIGPLYIYEGAIGQQRQVDDVSLGLPEYWLQLF